MLLYIDLQTVKTILFLYNEECEINRKIFLDEKLYIIKMQKTNKKQQSAKLKRKCQGIKNIHSIYRFVQATLLNPD